MLVNFLGPDLTNWYQISDFELLMTIIDYQYQIWDIDLVLQRVKKNFPLEFNRIFEEELFESLELVEGFKKKMEQDYYVHIFLAR